jgi:hypothetical protein
MVVMFTPLRQVDAWTHPSKRLKVVDEMRLVEIPAGERQVCPPDGLPFLGPSQRLLKAQQAAEHFRRESDSFLEQGDEALGTQAKVCGNLSDGAPLWLGLKRGQRERDGRRSCLFPGHPPQEKTFEDLHPVGVRLGSQQVLAQLKGGSSEDVGKVHRLVGQLGGRHRQKRARTTWLEADTDGGDQGGRINDSHLRKGTVEHAAMKALKLAAMSWSGDGKRVMAEIDHHRHPAIGKTAFPGGKLCLPFRDAERLNVPRKQGRGEKTGQDSQESPPIDGSYSRHFRQMASAMRGTHHPTIGGQKGMLFQCIPHSLIKNKGLAHMIATLTQLSTQKEVFNKDSAPIFADFCTQLLTASLWVWHTFGEKLISK